MDNGLFSELASTLSSHFGKVYYVSPWVSDLPSSTETEIGEGFPDFERVKDIWEIIDEVDLFVFTDLHQGPLQTYLVWNGKRVWGARYGDELETSRAEAKAHFKELGIPQSNYEVVDGMPDLRKYLKGHEGQKSWVKISLTRGDTETFPVENYAVVKNMLDTMEADLGPAAEHMEFIVEDDLPDSLDIAIDTYSINGQYPSSAMLGTEQKDEAYVCSVKDWSEMPESLIDIYEKLSPTLEGYQYKGMLSLESRVGKNQAWLCDPCCRCGSPPFELQLNMIENLAEILWFGAEGKMVQPEFKGKYGVELIVQSEWADDHPVLLNFPSKYREQIKLYHATQFESQTWTMPQESGERVAAVVTCGDDLEDCISEAVEIADNLKAFKLQHPGTALPQLRKNIEILADWGIII